MPAPETTFATNGIPSRERFDAYRAFMSGGFTNLRPTDAWRGGAAAAGRRWRLGGVVISHVSHAGLEMRRPAASARRPGNDVLVVSQYRRGGSAGIYDDQPYNNVPGSIALTEVQRSIQARSSGPVEMVTVAVPFDLIGYASARHGDPGNRHLIGPSARVLEVNLAILLKELPSASQQEGAALVAAFTGLVRGLLASQDGPQRRWDAFAKSRGHAIRAFVDDHVRSRTLGVRDVCAAVGASRATVYREFADDGGLHRYVQRHRVVRALHELEHSRPRRGLIREVADHWGFSDQASFARLARQLIGVVPSDVVGLAFSADEPARSELRLLVRAGDRRAS